ncbi:glycoside hydrolase family 76 protein [Corynebacterium aquilae]|uniref:Glycoside hydrolase family 76 n=1 Tax=Corynebacterium aquilae DSM 44791 TaxID=1431546 RepID=A0A1L7CI97_9CORY|nr:glycoside hydrolase family 76 protein [Corynebacterium aquilae]APT85548.1 glycoside hydrolase family 76 [Corynebacterium aquilae DSM 44791]
MQEKWAHRADLAEAAINERHSSRVWGIPRTNLAVVSWPATAKDKAFFRWHYWWQAHYLDCLIDAANRRTTAPRVRIIKNTMRGIRLRNLRGLASNRYYDDKSWLALAAGRVGGVKKLRVPSRIRELELDIISGKDGLTGVLPWRTNETFYNVPTNGPAAIMMARTGRLDQAMALTDWVYDNLVDERGLIMDGVRMRMHGPDVVKDIHPYCQGVMLGACLEISNRLREHTGVTDVASVEDAEKADEVLRYVTRLRDLVHAIAKDMATPQGVIDWNTGGGDGGLFKGILVRYLADVAVSLPDDTRLNKATKKIAARLVLSSAESVWNHRLEVDGLPVFAASWTEDARLPQNTGPVGSSHGGAVSGSSIPERDLSVQLSGWMLLEAAARVAAAGYER